MNQVSLEEMVNEFLNPFINNEEGSLEDYKKDLIGAFSKDSVDLEEKRINPFTLYRDIADSILTNLRHRNFKAVVLNFFLGGLVQAIPAYKKTKFSKLDKDGKVAFEMITLYKTGIVLEPISLLLTYLFIGVPIPVVNCINWIGGAILTKKNEVHEWNHVFDSYIIQCMYTKGLITNVEKACIEINRGIREPIYEVPSINYLINRAKILVKKMFDSGLIKSD